MGQQVDRSEQDRAANLTLRVACGLQQGDRDPRGVPAQALLVTATTVGTDRCGWKESRTYDRRVCCDVESTRLAETQPQRNKSPQDTGRGTGGPSCEAGGRVQPSFLPERVAVSPGPLGLSFLICNLGQ